MKIFCTQQETPSPARFTNTWLAKGSRVPLFYLLWRLFAASLALVGLVQSIAQNTLEFLEKEQHENIYKYFIYLTNNGRWVAAAALLLEAALVVQRYIARGEDNAIIDTDKQREGGSEPNMKDEVGSRRQKRLPIPLTILWVLTNISSSLSFMITIVYWSVLYNPARNELDFENFSGHLLIAVVHFVDVLVGDRPWRLAHSFHPVLFGCVYAVFSLSYYLAGGTNYHFEPYVYHITDWGRTGRTIGVLVGVTIALVTFHAFFCLLARGREALKSCLKSRRGEESGLIAQC